MSERVRTWAPDAALGLVVLALGLVSAGDAVRDPSPYSGLLAAAVAVGFAVAVALFRRAPGVGLALVWAAGALQLVIAMSPLPWQASVALVAFGCARWGSTATVLLSALSIPASAVVGTVAVLSEYYFPFTDDDMRQLAATIYDSGASGPVLAALLVLLALGAPWLAGLAVRFRARAAASRVSQEVAEADAARATSEREQAEEIARLRDGQARLAGDVHDVVGHSLAVILAQAESGQYLPDDDPARLKQTLATIASSARTSLQDVREVLATTRGEARTAAGPGELDELVEGVRRSGHQVDSSVVGRPQPLPPELAEVAYRVLQEMLTNAIRHGERGEPVHVERHWDGELRMEVVNTVQHDSGNDDTRPISTVETRVAEQTGAGGGQGLVGMRRRLESVGGRLDVRRRADSFTATAWVPVRR